MTDNNFHLKFVWQVHLYKNLIGLTVVQTVALIREDRKKLSRNN